ncbi:MAG: aldo/keto reductase [Treponema sp.]|nr:aldo/keto reductase [Treponema sp.]
MNKQLIIKGYGGDFSIDSRILRAHNFGSAAGEAELFAQMDAFAALGGRTFDTAAIYGDYECTGNSLSELAIGKWLKQQPNADEFHVITKGGHYSLAAPAVSRVTTEDLRADIERSLRALGRDTIDVYLLHRDNPGIPVGEIMECLDGFVKSGKIRALGSTWKTSRIMEANTYAEARGLQPFSCAEIIWGLAVPLGTNIEQAEMTREEYLACRRMGLTVFAEEADQNGIFADWIREDGFEIPENFAGKATRTVFERAKRLCEELAVSPEQMALAYILNNSVSSGVVVSAYGEKAIKDLMESADLVLSAEQTASLDEPRISSSNLYSGVLHTGRIQTIEIPAVPASFSISKIICGTSGLGSNIPMDESFKILDAYFAAGGRTFDSARVYGMWGKGGQSASERCIGDWIKLNGIRDEIQIITKGCHPDLAAMDVLRVGAKYISEDIEASLGNLQTGYIDIYQLHRDNPDIPVAEIIECLHGYVLSGTVRSLSASNWTTARIGEANDYAKSRGLTPFTSSEINRSLAVFNGGAGSGTLAASDEDLAFYAGRGIPILAWGSLGGGYIIKGVQGKLDSLNPVYIGQFGNEASDQRVRNTKMVMRDSGLSAEELCIAYLTNNSVTTASIIGASGAGQMEKLMKAAGLIIPEEIIADLEFLPDHVRTAMEQGAASQGKHPLDKPFDMDSTVKELMGDDDYKDIREVIFGNAGSNPALLATVNNLSLRQILKFPGAEASVSGEKIEGFLAAMNTRRLELLEERK